MKEAVVCLPKTPIESINMSSLTDTKISESAVTGEITPPHMRLPIVCIKKSDSAICGLDGYKASAAVNSSTDVKEENCEECVDSIVLPDTPVSVATDSCSVSSSSSASYSKTKRRKVPNIPPKKVKKQKLEGKQRRSSKNKIDEPDVYEVEKIVDHCEVDNSCVFYLVKWKNWDAKYNTWEPLEHLTNCEAKLLSYFSAKSGGKLVRDVSEEEVEKYLNALLDPTRESLENLMKSLVHKGRIKYQLPLESEIRRVVTLILKLPEFGRNREAIERIKGDVMLLALHKKRMEQLVSLKEWETEINKNTNDAVPIVVENEVDLEGRPLGFCYVNDYIPGKGVTIPSEPPIGCDCGTCDGRRRCCSKQSANSVFAYSPNRILRVPEGTPIYECNKICSCPANCVNRVVQNGRQVKLCIFRTSNGCGWGVKALEYIRKGMFVCEYVGEVIDNEEAERRGKKYDAEGRTYLFDLDYNEKEQCPYTVDAAVFGNVSHFINHSCNPNLAVFAVWINCLEPDLPKLALFAKRNIHNGEEITFDYKCQSYKQSTELEDNDSSPKTVCKCGSIDCRKYLF